jgi:hypothetical protein
MASCRRSYADVKDGNLVLARLQGKEQIDRGDERSEIISQTGGLSEEISSAAQIAAKRPPIITELDRSRPASIPTKSPFLADLVASWSMVISPGSAQELRRDLTTMAREKGGPRWSPVCQLKSEKGYETLRFVALSREYLYITGLVSKKCRQRRAFDVYFSCWQGDGIIARKSESNGSISHTENCTQNT